MAILASGPRGRRLGSSDRVRSYRFYHDAAERFSLDISTVLYIGANTGQELDILRAAYPDALICCFEPQPDLLPALHARAAAVGNVEVHPFALAAQRGLVTMRRSRSHDQASSLRVPNASMSEKFPHVGDWDEIEVETRPLDEWAAERDLVDDLMIKLDVQGAEDEVLAGGPDTFEKARMVVVEMAVVPTYEAAPSMVDMFTAFTGRGFSYAGEMSQVRDSTGAVIEFDGVFARSGGAPA